MLFSFWLLFTALAAADNDTLWTEEWTRAGGGFTLPPRPSSRWGPFFEDGPGPSNLTARLGSTLRLDCHIGMLHDKTVTWVRRKKDSIHLLTVGRQAYSSDQRISLSFRYPNNWRLEIAYLTRRDEGSYECQIATHPPKVRKIYLTVTAPEVTVIDEKEHVVSERYYKVGSSVELTCIASNIEFPAENITWKYGESLITSGLSVNTTMHQGMAMVKMGVQNAQKENSGNYTCQIGQATSTSVYVHIVNSEVPAAVQDESSRGVSSILAATWILCSTLIITQYFFHER